MNVWNHLKWPAIRAVTHCQLFIDSVDRSRTVQPLRGGFLWLVYTGQGPFSILQICFVLKYWPWQPKWCSKSNLSAGVRKARLGWSFKTNLLFKTAKPYLIFICYVIYFPLIQMISLIPKVLFEHVFNLWEQEFLKCYRRSLTRWQKSSLQLR